MFIKKSYTFFVFAFFITLWYSCSDTSQQNKNITKNSTTTDSNNCSNTIIDPNHTKPMALKMRLMAAQADSMKNLLKHGKMLDSTAFPLIKFYLSEPTDPSVLEPLFFENASLYEKAYRNMMTSKTNQIELYNAMIGACINCHQSYCSGPLKRIRKLIL